MQGTNLSYGNQNISPLPVIVLTRSNLTENRGQPRANRGLTAVRPRARRG